MYFIYFLHLPPGQDASHHKDFCIFSRESLYTFLCACYLVEGRSHVFPIKQGFFFTGGYPDFVISPLTDICFKWSFLDIRATGLIHWYLISLFFVWLTLGFCLCLLACFENWQWTRLVWLDVYHCISIIFPKTSVDDRGFIISFLIFVYEYMDVSKNSGTPKSSISIGFSIINHPFWGTPIFGNTHIKGYQFLEVAVGILGHLDLLCC